MSSHAAGLRTAALYGLLLSAAVAAGCNPVITGVSNPPVSEPPSQLAINPGALDLEIGQQVQLVLAGGDAGRFHWSSSNSSVVAVSAAGLVTALANGSAMIVAWSRSDCSQPSVGWDGSCASASVIVADRAHRRH